MTEITGYTKEEIDRLGWYDALYPDPGVRADAVARRDRILAGDEVRDAEWSITTANGERRHLSVSASRTPLEDGEVGVLTLVHDVTEKHAAALALAESERRHRAIFDESIAAIFLLGPGGRFVDANPAGLALLGYTRDELRALTVADVDADPESVPTRRAKLLADRRLVAHEHRVRRKDGRVLTVLDNTSVLAHGPDAETRAIATLLDITEHKHAEAERERLHEALDEARRLESVGRLAGGVAHDYNNMLGVILGSATAAIDLLEEGHPAREELEEVRKAATRSADLTRQLLGFARRQPARPEVLDLDERVAAALKMLARVVREDVRVLYSPGVDVPHVRIDPAQLDQILVNLAANARDAIAGTGTLRVETSRATIEAEVPGGPRPGTYAVVRVRDDGAGMSEDVRAHAFEPFFTTKGVGRGTGLGLATVHGIVKQNGGEVSLESAPGRGTVVTIHLPAQARAPRSAKALAAPPRGGAEVVLLVEDEPAVLRLVERTLRRLGYTVLAAPSPWEATRLAEEHDGPIDLLLTDVIMPGTSGRELARTLLATRPAMRTLFMSGYPAEEMSREGLIAEGAELVQKPFTVETLYASVRRALDGEDARSTGSPTRAP
jgi:PAS domain S-box-containing protein